jgi:hypothetical protein
MKRRRNTASQKRLGQIGLAQAFAIFGVIVAIPIALAVAANAKTRACTTDDVRRYEMLLGVTKGGLKTIPQLGFTIQYLGTERRDDGVCAVLVRRVD